MAISSNGPQPQAERCAAGGMEECRIITLKEAANMLSCSYSTALRLAADGELRAFRVRGSWRTSTSACEEFIERGFDEQESLSQAQRRA